MWNSEEQYTVATNEKKKTFFSPAKRATASRRHATPSIWSAPPSVNEVNFWKKNNSHSFTKYGGGISFSIERRYELVTQVWKLSFLFLFLKAYCVSEFGKSAKGNYK